jgi:hypothetical protein
MTLLLEKSKAIQYEAFTILEVIVSCPNKGTIVTQILKKNKEMLVKYIQDFQNDRGTYS